MNYDRNEKFKALFAPLTTYGIDSAIFERYERRECTFNRYCKSMVFSKSGRLAKLNKIISELFLQRVGKNYQ